MNLKVGKLILGMVAILMVVLTARSMRAQDSSGTVAGTVTDSLGTSVANAKVAAKNVATGQTTETVSDSGGAYKISSLTLGSYEVLASSGEFASGVIKVTLTGGRQQVANLALIATRQLPAGSPPVAARSGNPPTAASGGRAAPSLDDLGFSPAESAANAKEQALLDKRTHMLKIHQRMGLVTTVPLLATLFTSLDAGKRVNSSTSRNVHVALGAVTGDLYGITAYYAIRAPRVAGTETRGPIRLHKALAWVHGPGMILTPILGIIAYNQKSRGEDPHGLGRLHGPVAVITAGSFVAALLSVSVKF